MFCKKYNKAAIQYIYQELDNGCFKEFEKHLHGCERCTKGVHEMRKTLSLYRQIPVGPVDQRNVDAIIAQIPQTAPIHISKAPWWKQMFNLSGLSPVLSPALTGLAVIILALVFLLPRPQKNDTAFTEQQVTAWDSGVEDSLDLLQDRIDDVEMDDLDLTTARLYDNISGYVQSVTEQQIEKLEKEIDRLQKEWASNTF